MNTNQSDERHDQGVSVIIPAYNEAQYIEATLADLIDHGYRSLIVVDDGSTDDTYERASQYAVVLRHVVNRGMGAALVTGTTYAVQHGAEMIVHFDADGQHRASEIERVLDPLRRGVADVVLGSRYLQANRLPFIKKYCIHMPALLFQNIYTGVTLTDVHNGFRALNRHAAEVIGITQDRMAHNTEIISEVRRHHLRYVEVPVTIVYHEFGQGFIGGMRIMRDLFLKKIL